MSSSASSSSSSTKSNSQADKCYALQWNISGLRANINELKQLIHEYEPLVIALQETKANSRSVPSHFVGSNYTLILQTGNCQYWQQGVGLAIREGVPFERIQLDCNLQAIAVRIHLPATVTVVSIYVPPSTQQCQAEMNKLFEQLQGPALILGDFNAHHMAWGSQTENSLGRFIAEKSLTKQMIILNDERIPESTQLLVTPQL